MMDSRERRKSGQRNKNSNYEKSDKNYEALSQTNRL